MTSERTIEERRRLGERIKAENLKRGLNLKTLSHDAKCSPKTLSKVFKGELVNEGIVQRICAVLQIRTDARKSSEVSDEDHGSYSLDSFSDYVGMFFAYRRGFTHSENFLRSAFNIRWDHAEGYLVFSEYQKYFSKKSDEPVDNSQVGEIYFSHEIGLVHFLTKHKGAIRLITVSKLQNGDVANSRMSGIVLTQERHEIYHQPTSAAIFFEKAEKIPLEKFQTSAGVIEPADSRYEEIKSKIENVEKKVANFALLKQ
jgi:transcriptional regulator with XRE-family HTH domain